MQNPPRDLPGAPSMSEELTQPMSSVGANAGARPSAPLAPGARSSAPLSAGSSYWGDLSASFGRIPAVVMGEQPFPRWFTVALPFGLAAVLGLAFVIEETVLHGDWSAGALAVGLAALLMALGTLAVWGVRFARGRKALSAMGLALALVVVLAGGGAAALAEVVPLHGAQAKQLESQRQWSAAINEYALSGADTPSSTNIARIYNEWGEDLLAQRSYAQAVTCFRIVLANYAKSGAPIAQANHDLYLAYSAWVKAGDPSVPYDDALASITAYTGSAACDASCKKDGAALEAQARYQDGLALSSAKRYSDAITQFELVTKKFGSTPFAAKAHAAAATAYLAYGKQLLTASCSDAQPLYQKLASTYGDTPEGKQASKALNGPVTVSGKLTNFPTNPAPAIYLSSQYNAGAYYYSDDYTGKLNTGSGAFTFTGVAQGTYYLNTMRNLGSTIEYNVFQDSASGNPYQIKVGPLCPLDLGSFSYA